MIIGGSEKLRDQHQKHPARCIWEKDLLYPGQHACIHVFRKLIYLPLFVVLGLLFQSWHISETWHWWCINDWRVTESFPLPCKSKQNHILVKRRVRDYSGIWRCVGRCTEPKCSTAWEQHVHNSHREASTFEGVFLNSQARSSIPL